MSPQPPSTAQDLARTLSGLGQVPPSAIAPVLDRACMESLLATTFTDAAGTTTPLWNWLTAALTEQRAWTRDDARALDAWVGGPPGAWWTLATGDRTLLDAWLDMALWRLGPANRQFLDLLETVPLEYFQGEVGRQRLLTIMRAERAVPASSRSSSLPCSAPASERLLGFGIDPFTDIAAAASISTPAQFAFARRRHARELAAWLQDRAHATDLMGGIQDAALRKQIASLSGSPAEPADAPEIAAFLAAMHRAGIGKVAEARAIARDNLHLAGRHDSLGRTVFMNLLDEDDGRGSRLSALGACARLSDARLFCSGRDRLGRTLLPYAIRSAGGYGHAGACQIARAVKSAEGPPGPDSSGHGLIHQIFSGPRMGAPPAANLESWDDSYKSLSEICIAPPSAWLGSDAADAHLPATLLSLVMAQSTPRSRGAAGLLAKIADQMETVAASLPPPWQTLFLNAVLMDTVRAADRYTNVTGHMQHAAHWILPHAVVDPRVDAAARSLQRSSAARAVLIVEAVAASRSMNALATDAARFEPAHARPRKARPRA